MNKIELLLSSIIVMEIDLIKALVVIYIISCVVMAVLQ